jgi:hypothetical protein
MLALAVVLAAGAAVLIRATRGNGPFFDEWLWAVYRRGSSAATELAPYNGHPSMLPVLAYKLLWATAGLRTYVPYRLLVIALHLSGAALVAAYARRRVGAPLAVLAAALIVFYGPGWQDILWPFQIGWQCSIVFGLVALVALDSRGRRGEVVACLALCASLASSGVGAAVAGGIALDVLAGPLRRRRAWVVLSPLALWALWWVTEQRSTTAPGGPAHTPAFVLHLVSVALAGLAGLWQAGTATDSGPVSWRVAFAVLAAALLVWRLAVRFRVRPLMLAAIPLAFAVAAGVNRAGVSSGIDSRYLYVVAVFAVLCGVELLAGWRPGPVTLGAAAALVAAAAIANVGILRDAGTYLRHNAVLVRADIGALALDRAGIGAGTVARDFPSYPYVALPARSLLTTAHDLGFSYPGVPGLLAAPEAAREVVDHQLVDLGEVRTRRGTPGASAATPLIPLAVRAGGVRRLAACLALSGGTGVRAAARAQDGVQLSAPARGLWVIDTGRVTVVAVRRFAAVPSPVALATPGRPAWVSTGGPPAGPPWQVIVAPSSSATVCPG